MLQYVLGILYSGITCLLIKLLFWKWRHINTVHSWPRPSSVKEVQRFLGVTGWYRKFIKNFSEKARPLTKRLEKNTAFVWNTEQEDAFIFLKKRHPCWNYPKGMRSLSWQQRQATSDFIAILDDFQSAQTSDPSLEPYISSNKNKEGLFVIQGVGNLLKRPWLVQFSSRRNRLSRKPESDRTHNTQFLVAYYQQGHCAVYPVMSQVCSDPAAR